MKLHVVISGVVQGVGYRAWLREQARAAGIRGWVRNRADGTVEAVLCGTPEAVEALVVMARQGPTGARVSHIEHSEAPTALSEQAGDDFVILRSV